MKKLISLTKHATPNNSNNSRTATHDEEFNNLIKVNNIIVFTMLNCNFPFYAKEIEDHGGYYFCPVSHSIICNSRSV